MRLPKANETINLKHVYLKQTPMVSIDIHDFILYSQHLK